MAIKMKKTKEKNPMLRAIIAWTVVFVLIFGYLIFTLVSAPKVSASVSRINLPETASTAIAWPAYGQSAVGASGFGVLATNGQQTAHPIASIAKLILAISVLKKYPLQVGQAGPTLTMSQDDVNLYDADLAQSGSLVPVNFGEQLAEYQMLQALLIASGDNIADSLANWAFGSTDNYIAYANKMLAEMNLPTTHVADASGLSPQTVSSAHDLVLLGETSLQYPVLAAIVNQQSVTLPIAGTITNYDADLGQNGVIGIKTGNTTEAGGCFLFAVKNSTDPNGPTIVGVILGATNLAAVLNDSLTFIQANVVNFKSVAVLKAGQVVGTYTAPWGQKVNAVAGKDLTMFTINNEKVNTKISINKIKSAGKGDQVGTVTASISTTSQTVPLILDSKLSAPTFLWKLAHPFSR
jgi:D-alanyl-D-alanine carboxypeptidase (penicillin-binding protein 5/6)